MKAWPLVVLVFVFAAWCSSAQQPESRPATRPADRQAEIDRIRRERIEALKALVDGARAKEPMGGAQAALAACDRAETDFWRHFDTACTVARAGVLSSIDLYKELITFADGLAERVETAEYEAEVPGRDLLSATGQAFWGASAGAKLGFSGRGMTIEGLPVDGRKVIGVASALPSKDAPWRDVLLDLEFTVLSGEMDVFVRYWPDKKSYRLTFGPGQGYELGKPCRALLRIRGSTIGLFQANRANFTDRLSIDTSRTGGIGFGLRDGSKAVITRCEMKVLR
jgi:hypothetical protein